MFDLALLGILGLIVGSFVNALLWRLHEGISIAQGNSMCPHCRVSLRWYDLIPVFSYLALKGKCRSCLKPISFQYPLLELSCGILFVGAAMLFHEYVPSGIFGVADGSTGPLALLQLALTLFFITVLTLLFVYDLRWYLLPDVITIPAIIIGYAVNGFLFSPQACFGTGFECFMSISWVNLLVAAVIGGGFFLVQYVISRGTWIGGGDIRLGALMGVIVGYPGILVALFLAYMLGSIVGIGLLALRKKGMKSEVPFGPFLALATLIMMFFGNDLITMLSALSIL